MQRKKVQVHTINYYFCATNIYGFNLFFLLKLEIKFAQNLINLSFTIYIIYTIYIHILHSQYNCYNCQIQNSSSLSSVYVLQFSVFLTYSDFQQFSFLLSCSCLSSTLVSCFDIYYLRNTSLVACMDDLTFITNFCLT